MVQHNTIFRKCKDWWRGGYFVPVKNSMSAIPKTDEKYLTVREKQLYEKEFGNRLIDDKTFIEWYCRIYQKK